MLGLESAILSLRSRDSEILFFNLLDRQITLFSMQALPSEPESIIVLEMFGTETQSASTVHLNIGLQVRPFRTLLILVGPFQNWKAEKKPETLCWYANISLIH